MSIVHGGHDGSFGRVRLVELADEYHPRCQGRSEPRALRQCNRFGAPPEERQRRLVQVRRPVDVPARIRRDDLLPLLRMSFAYTMSPSRIGSFRQNTLP